MAVCAPRELPSGPDRAAQRKAEPSTEASVGLMSALLGWSESAAEHEVEEYRAGTLQVTKNGNIEGGFLKGVAIAPVTQNKDPEKMCRVRLTFPW